MHRTSPYKEESVAITRRWTPYKTVINAETNVVRRERAGQTGDARSA